MLRCGPQKSWEPNRPLFFGAILGQFQHYICYVGVLLVALEAANLEPNVTSHMFGAKREQFLKFSPFEPSSSPPSCIQNSTPLDESEQNPRALLRTNVILAFCPDPLNLAYHNGQKRANHFQRGQSVQFLQGAALKGAREA